MTTRQKSTISITNYWGIQRLAVFCFSLSTCLYLFLLVSEFVLFFFSLFDSIFLSVFKSLCVSFFHFSLFDKSFPTNFISFELLAYIFLSKNFAYIRKLTSLQTFLLSQENRLYDQTSNFFYFFLHHFSLLQCHFKSLATKQELFYFFIIIHISQPNASILYKQIKE